MVPLLLLHRRSVAHWAADSLSCPRRVGKFSVSVAGCPHLHCELDSASILASKSPSLAALAMALSLRTFALCKVQTYISLACYPPRVARCAPLGDAPGNCPLGSPRVAVSRNRGVGVSVLVGIAPCGGVSPFSPARAVPLGTRPAFLFLERTGRLSGSVAGCPHLLRGSYPAFPSASFPLPLAV